MPLKSFLQPNNRPLSPAYYSNLNFRFNTAYYYGEKSLRIFTLVWLLYELYLYSLMVIRPAELYSPMVYFSKLFMPAFPGVAIFAVIWITALLCNIFSLYKSNVWIKALLALTLIWINLIKWGYGFNAHVGQLFLLMHILLIFFPWAQKGENDATLASLTKLFYTGIFATYTFAGIWKVIGLLKYLVLKQALPLWLYPNAMLYNVISLNIGWDVHLGPLYKVFEFSLLWQVMILFVIFLQTFSVVAVLRPQLIPFWVASLIGMHLFNAWVTQVEFYTSIFALAALFWPFIMIKKADLPVKYTLEYTNTSKIPHLKRVYNNSETDEYEGFYATREFLYESGKWYASVLYFPGITYLLNSLLYKNSKKHS